MPDQIGSGTGAVTQPDGISATFVTIEPNNITPHRPSTIFGIFVQPATTGGLDPRIVSVLGPNGKPLAVQYGRTYVPADAVNLMPRPWRSSRCPNRERWTIDVSGQNRSTGSYTTQTTLPGDLNGDGQVTIADLPLFAQAYESKPGDSNYNPAADFNQNGNVDLIDAKILMHNMTALTDKFPSMPRLNLAPADQAKYPTSQNSGVRPT